MTYLYYALGAIVAIWIAGSVSRHVRGRGKTVRIAEENCTACGKCLKRCKHHVFEIIKDDAGARRLVLKNPDKCTACGDCVGACKFKVLEIVKK
ncbi:MAG: ferredoxin family protein, partial [Prevotellaceae bacterium]|jgi:NAD-dependent dihydropyrimidine dehydrogenase PreA subunit|nr:ferredoxin family protein [Prevotellaceae bacterium]